MNRVKTGALLALTALLLPACGTATITPTAASSPPPAGPATSRITLDMLVIGGLAYPAGAFHIAQPDRCDAEHWHASKGGVVYSIGPIGSIGTAANPSSIECHAGNRFPGLSDPDPGGCGYGRLKDVPATQVSVDLACFNEWYKVGG